MKTLKKRKLELTHWCKEVYIDKPLKKWYYRKIEYKTTLETAINIDKQEQTSNYFSIKQNFHMQLFKILIMCFLTGCIFWLISKDNTLKPMIIFCSLSLVILIPLMIKIFDRKPKIILTEEGFWIHKMQEQIPWEYLAASYILKDYSGETIQYSIVIHYYEKLKNDFVRVEYNLYDLEMDEQDISFHIEKFKQKSVLDE